MLSYVYYWIKKTDDDQMKGLGTLLGAYWTEEQLSDLASDESPGKSKDMLTPMLLYMVPKMLEQLQARGKSSQKIEVDGFQAEESLMDMDKEAFKKLVQGA